MNLNTKFQTRVARRYQVYNSLFLTLPFNRIFDTGVLLPVLLKECEQGFKENKNPTDIIRSFFKKQTGIKKEEDRIALLFKFIQYIERQVVLFDAIEDAAFEQINDMSGSGSIKYVFNRSISEGTTDKLLRKFEDFKVRIVLTAHPTQFYPGSVLSIINELEKVIRVDDLKSINALLQQLGRTAFVGKEKPTPLDEATRLMWYLQNVFYHSVSNVHKRVRKQLAKHGVADFDKDIIEIGFWPGGDRDGNPFVTAETTLEVARQLRHRIFLCYFKDVKKLRKRMTFSGVDEMVERVYGKFSATIFNTKGIRYQSKQELINDLEKIKKYLETVHQGLFVETVDDIIVKVKIFGFHFTSMDIRQDSRIHGEVLTDVLEAFWSGKLGDSISGKVERNYHYLSQAEKIEALLSLEGKIDPEMFEKEITRETLKSLYAMKTIQEENGEEGCHRYIISNTQTALNIIEVYAHARICGWEKDDMTIDIVPLLETIEDLANGHEIMDALYSHPVYMEHLRRRNMKQYVMLGFSDGTKDGGYVKANWSIFQAKERLSMSARSHQVKIVFFDGRGGPPARGGGNTNKFYSSLGHKIDDNEIQLTVQGQTISSKFGTLNSSQYNLEQLLSAGLENYVFRSDATKMSDKNRALIDDLATKAYQAYTMFKKDPKFIEYLEMVTVLQYYGRTNIGSRPTKRNSTSRLRLEDLRAIPFVGAWAQMKQNVPGFYGFGAALKQYEEEGRLDKIKDLFKESLFFRTLVENSMQSISKTYFPLTAYLEKDKKFGKFWKGIYEEYETAKRLLLEVAGQKELLEDSPSIRESIELRENIILPLITIQQYALMQLRSIENGSIKGEKLKAIYEKIVIRAFFGSINASRNAA